MQVKKRDGTLEDLNVEKLHKVVMYACEGIAGATVSLINCTFSILSLQRFGTELPARIRNSALPLN